MTAKSGPGNYELAELNLDMAAGEELGSDRERSFLLKAQVRATLALAAATALAHARPDGDQWDRMRWIKTAAHRDETPS